MKLWVKVLLLIAALMFVGVVTYSAVLDGREWREAQRVQRCLEGKFQYQVLADCSKINGCSFGPEELAYVRSLRQNCREGE